MQLQFWQLIPCPFLLGSQTQVNLDIPIELMKGIRVRWPRRSWNRASPSNLATKKYNIEMVVDMHTEVRRTLSCSWEDVDTTWRCNASLQCGSATIWMLYFRKAGFEVEALFLGLEVIWPESSSLSSMAISKVTCVWDPSWNGHRISCQNCSCIWYYSQHIRDICQGTTEFCTPMSCLHWGWWPSIWATVVRCKMVR